MNFNLVILDALSENFTLIFTLSMVLLIGLAVILFVLTGIILVSKNRIAIIERMGSYIETTEKTKFYPPLFYRRAGYYFTGSQKLVLTLPNKKNAIFLIEIKNVLLFHYSGHNITQEIDNIYRTNDKIDFETLKNGLTNIGINLINIEEAPAKTK